MKLRHTLHLLRDLIEVLPSHAREDWVKIEKIDPDLPTVILVSGFAATNRNLSIMRKRFLKDGYNVLVLSMDWQALSDGIRGLYRMSEKLSLLVLQLRKGKVRPNSRIYLVAHSAGGLVARHYVQLLGGFHYCDALVTLATPHRGIWWSLLGFFCHLVLKARVLLQITPASRFIRKINKAGIPDGFPILSLGSPHDYLCPPSRVQLPPTMNHRVGIQAKQISGLSHGDFLISKRCYGAIHDFLGAFEANFQKPPLVKITTP